MTDCRVKWVSDMNDCRVMRVRDVAACRAEMWPSGIGAEAWLKSTRKPQWNNPECNNNVMFDKSHILLTQHNHSLNTDDFGISKSEHIEHMQVNIQPWKLYDWTSSLGSNDIE